MARMGTRANSSLLRPCIPDTERGHYNVGHGTLLAEEKERSRSSQQKRHFPRGATSLPRTLSTVSDPHRYLETWDDGWQEDVVQWCLSCPALSAEDTTAGIPSTD